MFGKNFWWPRLDWAFNTPWIHIGHSSLHCTVFFQGNPLIPKSMWVESKNPWELKATGCLLGILKYLVILGVSFELMQIFQDCVFRVAVWALLDLWAPRAPYVSFRSGLMGIVGGKRRELKCTDPFLEEWSGWEKRGCGTAGSSWSEGKDPRIGSKSCGTKLEKGRG